MRQDTIKLTIFGFGLSIARYFCGGAPGVTISWAWQLTFYWRWWYSGNTEHSRGWWWGEKCFYGQSHEINTGPKVADYRDWANKAMSK